MKSGNCKIKEFGFVSIEVRGERFLRRDKV